MGIFQRVTVVCDQCGCNNDIVVRCTLWADKVPGPLSYEFYQKDWKDFGWQRIVDSYEEYTSYYCPKHNLTKVKKKRSTDD